MTRLAWLLVLLAAVVTLPACDAIAGATPLPVISVTPPPGPAGPVERAHVVRVVDGDTVVVDIGGRQDRVRYIGIDTPESVQPNTPVEPFAREAAAENAALVRGRDVLLERDVSERDDFGRLLRYVWVESTGDGAAAVRQLRTGRARVRERRHVPARRPTRGTAQSRGARGAPVGPRTLVRRRRLAVRASHRRVTLRGPYTPAR